MPATRRNFSFRRRKVRAVFRAVVGAVGLFGVVAVLMLGLAAKLLTVAKAWEGWFNDMHPGAGGGHSDRVRGSDLPAGD